MVEQIAFIFPGQGSQYIGMGKSSIERSSQAKALFDKANHILGYDLSSILLNGPEEKLKETAITQPALFLASAAALETLKEKGIKPSIAAGHSLGEYSALYAAGVLSFDNALLLVNERAKAMNDAAKASKGTMAAVMGLDEEKILDVCAAVSSGDEVCSPANYNSATQVAISGSESAVLKAMEKAKEAGAIKVVQLNVSGAFHSALMTPAADKLKPFLDQTPFSDAAIPVITNVDATPTTKGDEFKTKLFQQINHSVLWNKTMQSLVDSGISATIEVGSGRVLTMLMKKFDRKKTALWTDDFDTIEKTLATASRS